MVHWERLCIKSTTKERLKECREIFLKAHPEFKHYNITQDFILNKIIDFYMEDEDW